MATWTTIPDSSLEPGKPIRAIDALALRDNPVSITEGASGAPRIAAAALQTGTPETDWVLGRNAGASTGAVGTYAFLGEISLTTTAPGATRAGSSLRYAGIASINSFANNSSAVIATGNGGTPAGTWRAMGRSLAVIELEQSYYPATLWLRIA